jgi:hypothetical protein
MKHFFVLASTLVVLTAPAFAANSKAQTVNIPETVQVGSTLVPAGDYKVTWTGSGSNVQVTLAQNQKAVVTFPAKATEGKNSVGVETETQGGVVLLESIQLSKLSLVVEGLPHSGQ